MSPAYTSQSPLVRILTPAYIKHESEHILNSEEIIPCDQAGNPVYMSWPHFLHGDSILREAVDGLTPPDVNNHSFVLDIQPDWGITLSAKARFQFNVLVEPTKDFPWLSNVKDKVTAVRVGFVFSFLAGNAAIPYAGRGSAQAEWVHQGPGGPGDHDGGQGEELDLAGGGRPLLPLHGSRDLPVGEIVLPSTHMTVSQFSSPSLFPSCLHNILFIQW